MNYTKGEWIADNGESELWGIFQKQDCQAIAYLCEPNGQLLREEEAEANAQLIAAAVNACISVNPDNPLAVAESIKDMYEALKTMQSWLEANIEKVGADCEEADMLKEIQPALAKAEGGET